MTTFDRDQRLTPVSDDKYTQVVTFGETGKLVEFRALYECGSLSVFSVRSVSEEGVPGEDFLAGASVKVLNQSPQTSDQFQSFVLDRPLVVRPGDRVAIEVYQPSYSGCTIAINSKTKYAGGALFLNGEMHPGSMVFQTLIER
jgi:hypothetical protein